MIRNTDKSHLLVSGTKYEHKIWESNEVKLLGVTIDSKLKFDSYFANICLKAIQKLRALSSLAKLLTCNKKIILLKHFVIADLLIILWLGCFVIVEPVIELTRGKA